MAGTRGKNHSDGHLNLTYVRIYLGTIPIITGASFCYISVKAGSQSGEIANSDMVLGRSWDVSTTRSGSIVTIEGAAAARFPSVRPTRPTLLGPTV